MMQRAASLVGVSLGTLICLIAVVCVIGLSVFMNGYFAFIRLGGNVRDLSLATVEVAALAGALVIASIDVLKAFAPVFCARALANQKYTYVAVSLVLLIGGMTLSMVAAYGLIMEQRAGLKSARVGEHESFATLSAAAKDAEARIAALGFVRPIATIAAELTAEEQNVRWSASHGCTDVTVTRSREFCAAYHTRQAELASAKALGAERTRHAELLAKLAAIRDRGGVTAIDPQLEGLAAVTGWPVATLETALLLLVAVMIEFVSAFGLYLVFGHSPKGTALAVPPVAAPAAPTVAALASPLAVELGEYGMRRLEHLAGAFVNITDLYTDYREWCTAAGLPPMSQRQLKETLTTLAANVDGIELRERGRKTVLLNMQLRTERAAA